MIPSAIAVVVTGAGVVVMVDAGWRALGGVADLPNQSVLIPRAARTAKATEARMPVRVLGKAREARERGRWASGAVRC